MAEPIQSRKELPALKGLGFEVFISGMGKLLWKKKLVPVQLGNLKVTSVTVTTIWLKKYLSSRYRSEIMRN